MIVGQTMLSVHRGMESRAEAALQILAMRAQYTSGHVSHRILRSFGMSPLASALGDVERASALSDVHFILESEWDSLDAHDEFYSDEAVQAVYGTLQPILTSGPFEVLYGCVVEQPEHNNVAI